MTQLTLFDLGAQSRTTDPPSSHEAAERVTASGRRDANARAVLALVTTHPGQTSVELWQLSAGRLERHEVSRRLADLERLGRVTRGPLRACRVRGTTMLTWHATGSTVATRGPQTGEGSVFGSASLLGDPGASGGMP